MKSSYNDPAAHPLANELTRNLVEHAAASSPTEKAAVEQRGKSIVNRVKAWLAREVR